MTRLLTRRSPQAITPVRRAAHGRRRRRGSTMVEFALILPSFVFMMLFTIDMGSLVLMKGAMSDATFTSARAGAQLGGANVGVGAGRAGISERTFYSAVEQIPMSANLRDVNAFTVLEGGTCVAAAAGGLGSTGDAGAPHNSMVRVQATYTMRMITPGLSAMLNMIGGNGNAEANGYQVTSTGVARCEVYR